MSELGRSQKELDKHNVRDALALLETVEKYYLLEGSQSSTDNVRAAARILRVAADRLEREIDLRTSR